MPTAASSLAQRNVTSERIPRALLGVVGTILCLGPLASVHSGGHPFALLSLCPLGALLIVLAAFHPRVAGEVQFGVIRLSIEPGEQAGGAVVSLDEGGAYTTTVRRASSFETAVGE